MGRRYDSPEVAEVKRRMADDAAIFDGRNIYDPAIPRDHGFTYYSIGRR
nr:UDP-glucose 6-dehydrogenase [bacterium]